MDVHRRASNRYGIPRVKRCDLRSRACAGGFECACVLVKADGFNVGDGGDGRSGGAGEGV